MYTAAGPLAARKLLMARRLIEAGARVVSVSISDFDTHSENFSRMRQLGPIVDHALWALVLVFLLGRTSRKVLGTSSLPESLFLMFNILRVS